MMLTRTLGSAAILLATVVALARPATAQFTPIAQPDAPYLAATTLFPVTDPDFSAVGSLSNGTVTSSFDVDLAALTVPTTWGSWDSPPDTESATPRVLWSNGFTSVALTFSLPLSLFGFEAQPNTLALISMTATFFNGMAQVGQIMQNVDGNGGARLFAATSTTPFDSVVLSSTGDFAIAQLRAGTPVDTPPPTQTPTRTRTETPTRGPTNTPASAGATCDDSADCTSDLVCVDGVCCTSACDGPDQRCDIPPDVGTCRSTVVTAPAASHPALLIGLALLVVVAFRGLSRRRPTV